MSRQHSIVPHRANYFFLPLEDDYLAMYEDLARELDPLKEANEEKLSGPSDCKAMIASVLEAWMNSKRPTAKNDEDLFVYYTYDEWEQALRYRYKRSTIIQCLKEMEGEGMWLDREGKYGTPMMQYRGTIKKRHFVQNTFEYQLNLPVVLDMLTQLPEQSPFEQRARPSLGRPRKSRVNKNRPEINGLKESGLISDGQSVKIDDGSVKIDGQSVKTNAPFYTQIIQTNQTSTERALSHANELTTPSSDASASTPAPDPFDVIIPGHDYAALHLDANCAEWRAVNQGKTCQDYQAAINAARLAPARTITLAGMRPMPALSQDDPDDDEPYVPNHTLPPVAYSHAPAPVAEGENDGRTAGLGTVHCAVPGDDALAATLPASGTPGAVAGAQAGTNAGNADHRAGNAGTTGDYRGTARSTGNGGAADGVERGTGNARTQGIGQQDAPAGAHGYTQVDQPPLMEVPVAPKTTRKRGSKPPEEKQAEAPAPPVMPAVDAPWGTATCVQLFDHWRGAPLLTTHQLMEASKCAKAMAANYTRRQVETARRWMVERDPYWSARATGVDICQVAGHIGRMLADIETARKAKQAANVPQQGNSQIEALRAQALRFAPVAAQGGK